LYMVRYSTDMSTQYSRIQQANFSSAWSQTWSDSHSSKDQTRYVYMCCPAWYIVGTASYAAFGGSGIFQIYLSYWTGSAWSAESHYEVSATGGAVTRRYGHNRDEGNLNASHHSNYPLWRVRYWPSRSNSRWSLTIYAGGWGLAGYNYPTGQLIKSRGRAGTTCLIHSDGTTDNEANVRANIFNPLNRRGSPILASDDSELVYYPY